MKFAVFAVCLLVALTGVRCTNTSRPGTEDEFRSLTTVIDRNLVPGGQVHVNVGFFVTYMKLDPKDETMALRMYLRHSWRDEQLAHDGEDNLIFDGRAGRNIWVPDTFFTTALQVTFADDPDLALFRISPDGDVLFSQGQLLVTPCDGLKRAFRTQGTNRVICSIKLESYKYSTDHLTLGWREVPVAFSSDTPGGNITVADINLRDCAHPISSGTYSCLEWEFAFDIHADWLTRRG